MWVGGPGGGFGRPGQGAYARLADVLRQNRISSLRLCYRHPNVLPECALDIMAGVAYLTQGGAQPVVLVGHSFGGAVVITAGALHGHVAGVVALAPQTSGARLAGQLAARSLLRVHGKADTRLPYTCGVQIYHWAQEPKQLVLYEGAEHRLDECAAELDQLLTQWIPATLRSSVCTSSIPHSTVCSYYFPVLRCFQASLVCCSTSWLTLRVLRSWVPIIVNRRPFKTG